MSELESNTDRTQTDTEPSPGGRRFVMPAVVLGLLGGHMLFIFFAITLATGDPSFAVVPDYYQKAVDYDGRKADLKNSAALGWAVQLQAAPDATIYREREIVVMISDRDGEPIDGATVKMQGYHVARAGDPQQIELKETSPGRYIAVTRIGREGFWQFSLTADRGETRFVHEFRQYLSAPEQTR